MSDVSTPAFIPPSQAIEPIAGPDAGRAWPERFGLAVDRVLNVVLLNGDDTWTVSLHAAVAQLQGRRWGCILCGILGALVQRNHCAITLDPNTQETTGAALKAGALMALLIAVPWFGARFLIGAAARNLALQGGEG